MHDDRRFEQYSEYLSVVVNDAGQFERVVLAENWFEYIDSRALGEHLTQAANHALTGHVARQVDRLAELDDARPEPVDPGARPSAPSAPSASGDPTDPVAVALRTEIVGLLDQLAVELAEVTAELTARGRTEYHGHSDARHVVAVVTGGQVTVDVRARWADEASSDRIGHEVCRALRSAHRAAAAEAQVPVPPAIARIDELNADPDALLRQLGLAPLMRCAPPSMSGHRSSCRKDSRGRHTR